MKRSSWLWLLMVVAAGVCTSSCVTRLRSEVAQPEKAVVPAVVRPSAVVPERWDAPPVLVAPVPLRPEQPLCEPAEATAGRAMLDRRLGFYQARLVAWQVVERQLIDLGLADRLEGWSSCLAEASELRDQYEMAGRQVEQAEKVEPGDLLDRDIGYLNSGCDAVLALGTAAFAGWSAAKTPAAAAHSATLPVSSLLPAAQQQFGLALLRAGQFEAAANVLAGEEGGTFLPDEDVAGQLLAADLLLAVGRTAEARRHYERLRRYGGALHGANRWVADQLELLQGEEAHSATFPDFRAMLRAYLLFDGQQVPEELRQGVARLEEQAPSSTLAKQGRRLLEMVEEKIGNWLPARLSEVELLVRDREFDRALAILEGLGAREDLDSARQAMVHAALLKARQAKFLAEETQPISPEQEAAGQWEQGVQLLEAGQYDEAVAIFDVLRQSGAQPQAREKLGEASDLAIKPIRSKASALFVQAKQTANLERKKSLLMESWKLLKGAETRYPGATPAMLEKVRQNLAYLEEYIRQVDPNLFGQAR